jgi:hypothetical protein
VKKSIISERKQMQKIAGILKEEKGNSFEFDESDPESGEDILDWLSSKFPEAAELVKNDENFEGLQYQGSEDIASAFNQHLKGKQLVVEPGVVKVVNNYVGSPQKKKTDTDQEDEDDEAILNRIALSKGFKRYKPTGEYADEILGLWKDDRGNKVQYDIISGRFEVTWKSEDVWITWPPRKFLNPKIWDKYIAGEDD